MIICGDSFEVIPTLEDNSISLAFLDPPYDMKLNKKELIKKIDGGYYNTVNEDWDNIEDYYQYSLDYLSLLKSKLHENGTIWLCGTYHGIFKAGHALQELGYWILNNITWIKTPPTPNFTGTRFCQSTETIIWAKKSEKSKYTFNYQELKLLNNGKQMRSDWYFPPPRKMRNEQGENINHAQKPEELIALILKASTKPGDKILDPFAGTLTTAVVCERMGLDYVMIEQDEKQIEFGKTRLSNQSVLIDKLSL